MRNFSTAELRCQRPSKDILEFLVCPLSKGKLFYNAKSHEVVSVTARVAFPVSSGGIINLCPHDARVLKDDEIPQEIREG